MITGIVLTKNNEDTIERTIKSLHFCNEIIIVDDYSKDKTTEISKKYTEKILRRRLNGDFSAQRNFGLTNALNDWVLFIDSDEWVSSELKNEIIQMIQHDINTLSSGYKIKRVDYFLGKWLKYGETGDKHFLRLARKDSGNWTGNVHEVWNIEGKVKILENPIFHYPHQSISEFLNKINKYTDILIEKGGKNRKTVSAFELVSFPIGKFIQNYIVRLGFLDGIPGLIHAGLMSFHSFIVRAKQITNNR